MSDNFHNVNDRSHMMAAGRHWEEARGFLAKEMNVDDLKIGTLCLLLAYNETQVHFRKSNGFSEADVNFAKGIHSKLKKIYEEHLHPTDVLEKSAPSPEMALVSSSKGIEGHDFNIWWKVLPLSIFLYNKLFKEEHNGDWSVKQYLSDVIFKRRNLSERDIPGADSSKWQKAALELKRYTEMFKDLQ